MHTVSTVVPADQLARHRRAAHRAGGTVILSAPVAGGYLVTVSYR